MGLWVLDKNPGGSILVADKDVRAVDRSLKSSYLITTVYGVLGWRHWFQEADIYCEVYGLCDFYYCKRLGWL